MVPSLTPIVDPSVKARLYARAGNPILSTINARSLPGMIARILSSTSWKILSVTSILVPAGARTCSWIWPPSMSGKKSRPTNSSIVAPSPSIRTAAAGTMTR